MIVPFRALTLWAALGFVAIAQDVPRDVTPPAPAPTTKTPPKKASLVPAFTEFCNVQTEPTSAVPGIPGLTFQPSTTSTSVFDRPFISPNGNLVLTALTNQATATDEVILRNGAVLAQEGAAASFDAGNMIGTIDTRLGVNDAGDVVFTTNTAPSTVNDDFVVKIVGGTTFVAVAQEGQPTATLPGVTYDDGLTGANIVSNGDVGFEADLIDGAGVTTANDQIYELGATLIAQEGVTVPANQGGGTTDAWSAFDLEDVWFDADGTNVLIRGDTVGATATDDVLTLNNAVVLQEGFVIPGSGFVNPIDDLGLVGSNMDLGGNWYARGNNDGTEDDWVVRNGLVIATVGQPITTGATELWDDAPFADCFFAHTGNAAGHFVVGGVTDNANLDANGVLVLDGQTVVCREGDPIDLDNNGSFDDGAFFNTFGNDDLALTEACELYFTATIRDAAGAQIGHGLFRLDLPCGCGPVNAYGSGCAGSGGFVPSLDFGGCAASSQVLVLEIDQALGGAQGLLFIGASPQSLAVPNSPCTLLVNPLITVNLPLPGAGPGNGSLTLPALLPAGLPPVSVFMQLFVVDPGVAHGFAASNGVQITFP